MTRYTPRVPNHDQRIVGTNFKLSPVERARLDAAVARSGKSLSTFCREVLIRAVDRQLGEAA